MYYFLDYIVIRSLVRHLIHIPISIPHSLGRSKLSWLTLCALWTRKLRCIALVMSPSKVTLACRIHMMPRLVQILGDSIVLSTLVICVYLLVSIVSWDFWNKLLQCGYQFWCFFCWFVYDYWVIHWTACELWSKVIKSTICLFALVSLVLLVAFVV